MNVTSLGDGSLRVEILPPRNRAAYTMMFLVLIVGIATLAGLEFVRIRKLALHSSGPPATLFRIVEVVECLAAAFILAEVLTGREILKLNRKVLLTQHRVLGVTITRHRFSTPEVRNLRFEEWQQRSGQKLFERSGLRFEIGSTTQSFGNMLSPEVNEIIAKMRLVYPFPQQR